MNYIGEYRREVEARRAKASEERIEFLAVVVIAFIAVIWFYAEQTLQAIQTLL